jgi:hypothetical protein
MPLPFILGAAGVALATFTAAEVIAIAVGAFALGAAMRSKSKEEVIEKVREAGFSTLALFIEMIDAPTYKKIKEKMGAKEQSEEESIKEIIRILKEVSPDNFYKLKDNIDKKINEVNEIYEKDKFEQLKELKKYLGSVKSSFGHYRGV